MTSASWDPQGEALNALRAIAADPKYGADALSSAPMMTNLLKDMLPDAPREANVLITAAGAGTATALQGYAAQGMDRQMASRLAAGTLAERTALNEDACAWATGSLAEVLFPPGVPPQASTADTVHSGGSDQVTISAHGVGAATGPGVVTGGPAGTGTLPVERAPGRGGTLSLLAACVAWAGALATILACAFSFVHIYNSDGTYAYSESLFNLTSEYGGAWHWIGPVVAAALCAVAALVLVLSRASWLRAAAAGVIAAFGVAVGIFFAAYQFTLGPVSSGAGPAGAERLGAFGGLLLLVAGLLGIMAAAGNRSVSSARA
jgi:hypothetical protein